ncbi:copper-binding protein, partial [Pigmentiphaga humi]|uniref:copper-binding protein n=1 Tax=Pigmentiphaga humi TaxID=2478468 RepID=UPI000F52BBE4
MEKIIRRVVVPVACVVAAVSGPVGSYAQGHDHHGHGAEAPAAVKGTAQGEIRRIDKANGRVTIRHGEIAHLDMPGMTMVFGVKELAVLEGVAVGDKV